MTSSSEAESISSESTSSNSIETDSRTIGLLLSAASGLDHAVTNNLRMREINKTKLRNHEARVL